MQIKERPGACTPWIKINQLLNKEERFEVQLSHWRGFLFAPKHSSQLAALLYCIQQEKIGYCVQGRGSDSLPTEAHAVIISTRAFSHIQWYEQGVVEVGGGCPLSLLHQFLFERNHEVALEEDPVASPKRSVAGLILAGKTAGLRYRGESLLESILGMDIVTWEGSQVRWGGIHPSAGAGPMLYKLLCGLGALPGIIIKIILKTYPIPFKRLHLAWSFRQREKMWQQFYALKDFSSSWEYLDVVLSGDHSSQSFIFAQISGLSEEMEAFSHQCPGYDSASQQAEKLHMKQFFNQQTLKSYCVPKDYVLNAGEYLWVQEGNSQAWLLTSRSYRDVSPIPVWKQRLWDSFYE